MTSTYLQWVCHGQGLTPNIEFKNSFLHLHFFVWGICVSCEGSREQAPGRDFLILSYHCYKRIPVVFRSCNEIRFAHGSSQQGQCVPLKISLHEEVSPTCLKSQIKKMYLTCPQSTVCPYTYLCTSVYICIYTCTYIHTKTKCKHG